MENKIHKVYNQKEFLELMRKKIKKNSVIIFDERGKGIFDSRSAYNYNLKMAELFNDAYSRIRKTTGGLLPSKKEENLIKI